MKNLESNSENKAKPMLAEVFNCYTNDFGDRIVAQGTFHSKGGYISSFAIMFNGSYMKAVGGVNVAKSFINKKRGTKCKWVGTVE